MKNMKPLPSQRLNSLDSILCKKTRCPIKEVCSDNKCDWYIKNEKHYNCTWVACNFGPFTLEQVGEMMGITRERVRQIEAKALKKLEKRGRRQRLQDFVIEEEKEEEKKAKVETSKYLTENEAAAMLGLKPVTLQNQRCRNSQNKGVPYMKIGHRVWYNLRDIKYYIEYYKERRRKKA